MKTLPYSKIKNYLLKSGVSTDAGELIRKLTAPYRHEARVNEVLNEVNRYYEENLNELNIPLYEVKDEQINEINSPFLLKTLVKALICYFDFKGLYGGGLKEPGAGTTRLLKVGKGRRQASDGPAYLSATLSAVHHLIETLNSEYSIKLLVNDEALIGFNPWFITVKDLVKCFPGEVKDVLIFQLVKMAHEAFNNDLLTETDLLNLIAHFGQLIDEIKQAQLVG